MKAVAIFPGNKQFKVIRDFPEPRIESPKQIKARMLDVGICGTDKDIVHFQYGTPPEGSPYLVIGHESLGEVVETGAEVSQVHKGDLIVLKFPKSRYVGKKETRVPEKSVVVLNLQVMQAVVQGLISRKDLDIRARCPKMALKPIDG